MKNHYKAEKTGRGWEVSFDGCFSHESESEVYPSKAAAQDAARRADAEYRQWMNAPACDAPHMDAF